MPAGGGGHTRRIRWTELNGREPGTHQHCERAGDRSRATRMPNHRGPRGTHGAGSNMGKSRLSRLPWRTVLVSLAAMVVRGSRLPGGRLQNSFRELGRGPAPMVNGERMAAARRPVLWRGAGRCVPRRRVAIPVYSGGRVRRSRPNTDFALQGQLVLLCVRCSKIASRRVSGS